MLTFFVVGAVTVALVVPSVGLLAGFNFGPHLGFTRSTGHVSPLSQRFVRNRLGLPPLSRVPSRATEPGDAPGVVGVSGPSAELGHASQTADPTVTSSGEVVHHAFTNDDFQHAFAAQQLPFTATTNSSGETRQTGEPKTCRSRGGTAWYSYTVTTTGTLFADTFGTKYSDALAAFTGPDLSRLHQVACGESLAGQSQIGFHATSGSTYYFQITGSFGGGGSLLFHLVRLGATLEPTARPLFAPPALSGNGRWLAFDSQKWPGCPYHALLLTNLRSGHTRRLLCSHKFSGPFYLDDQHDEGAGAVFDDVRLGDSDHYVGFDSNDGHLVPGDTNGQTDSFEYDTWTHKTIRVSVSSGGGQARVTDGQILTTEAAAFDTRIGSLLFGMSASGRYVLMQSDAADLTPGDQGVENLYRHDLKTGRTVLVSRGPNGQQLLGGLALADGWQSMSADGEKAVFTFSSSSPLCETAALQPPNCVTSYLWNAATGRARPISLGNQTVGSVAIAPNGRRLGYFVTVSNATTEATFIGSSTYYEANLNGTNIRRISPASSGDTATVGISSAQNQTLPFMWLSRTGRYVTFTSSAPHLVPGDTNNSSDVFVRDMRAGSIVRVSLTDAGKQRNEQSYGPVISMDGRTVTYAAAANSAGLYTSTSHAYVHRSQSPGTP